MPHQPGRRHDVDLQRLGPDPVPGRLVGLDAAIQPHDRGIVDQHVDPPGPGQRVVPEPVDLARDRQIGADQAQALRRDVAGGRRRTLPVGAIVRHQPRPGSTQGLRHGSPDSFGGTGEQDRLPRQIVHLGSCLFLKATPARRSWQPQAWWQVSR